MPESFLECPACETRIRFRSGVPNRKWLECPACGEDFQAHEAYQEPPRNARQRRAGDDEEWDRRPASSGGLWVGIVGGAIGLLGIVFGLLFYFWAKNEAPAVAPKIAENQPAANEDAKNLFDQLAKPPEKPAPNPVVAKKDDQPPVANNEPPPKQQPRADGVIPAPPDAGAKRIADDSRLKYGLKPGLKVAYRTTIKAEVGNEVHRISGMAKYEVVGNAANVPQQNDEPDMATGTGFVVASNGYLVTCAHVVEDAETIEVDLGGKTYEARVVEVNSKRDLALIRISAQDLPALSIGPSSKIELAQHVRVVGYPLSDVLGTSVKITQGSVAGFIDKKNGRLIQVDASINPGNSGGPLINNRGEVIGVASAGYFGSQIAEVGLAVPSDDVSLMLKRNGLSARVSANQATLDGPQLARQTTPSVAYLRVTVGAGSQQRLNVKFFSTFHTSKQAQDGRPIITRELPKSSSGLFVMDEYGQIYDQKSETTSLPYALGGLSTLAWEPLSPQGEVNWSTQRISSITQKSRTESSYDPYSRFGPRSRSRFGPPIPRPPLPFGRGRTEEVTKIHPALELASYELADTTPQTQVVQKNYEFQTMDNAERPFMKISGTGTLRYDRGRNLPDQLHYQYTFQTRTDDGKVVTIPLDILCERYTDEELAKHEQAVADARAKQAKPPGNVTNPRQPPQAGSNNEKSLEDHLKILNDPDAGFSKHYISLSAVARVTVDDKKRKDVLDAVEPFLESTNSSLQNSAIRTFGEWGTDDRNDILIEMAGGLSQSLRWAAMRALGKIGGKTSAEAVVKQLTDNTDRNTAAAALKEMGPVAEAPVLKLIDHPEQPTRYHVYNILAKVGGPKSTEALKKKAETDPSGFNRAAASIALRDIERRASQE